MAEGENKTRVLALLAIGSLLVGLLLARSVSEALAQWQRPVAFASDSLELSEPPTLPPHPPLPPATIWVLDPIDRWSGPGDDDACAFVEATRARYPRWAPGDAKADVCVEGGDSIEDLLRRGLLLPSSDEGANFAYGPDGSIVVERRGERELAVVPGVGLVMRWRAR